MTTLQLKTIIDRVQADCALPQKAVVHTIQLFEDGATIPFIARYRKEVTGGLDELEIRQIQLRMTYHQELDSRKATVLASISEQGKLTPAIEAEITRCYDKSLLEDLYLPYKQKRKTRASVAIEKGLEPLANVMLLQQTTGNRSEIIQPFLNPELGVTTEQEALAGAMDIVAQQVAENIPYRQQLRQELLSAGRVETAVKKDWAGKPSKFEMYYQFSERLAQAPAHRLLAVRRAEKEGVISFKLVINGEAFVENLQKRVLRNPGALFRPELLSAVEDAYHRLLFPSISGECITERMAEADTESIRVFSQNTRELLMAPPAGQKWVLGVDPGFRTGCKVVVIDPTGDLKANFTIYPHEPQNQVKEAASKAIEAINAFGIALIAIGNGTASRETMTFFQQLVRTRDLQAVPVVVSEAGASVYSASDIARAEFPDLDLTVRGAISIARRLQDPLAELVKIDPKSIGVGQYQHDVNQKQLKESLDFTTETCVNQVGVNVNTASAALLTYVAGIGPAIADNIVKYRTQQGPFTSRQALKKVAKLGPKAFEQCAGFLRITESANPLDNSAIHPESYPLVEKMAKALGKKVSELIANQAAIAAIRPQDFYSDSVGSYTVQDIIAELQKPGRDPRQAFHYAEFNEAIQTVADLKVDMELDGIVTNVAQFGAFVDIGVHQDGLIHISKLSKSFVKNPMDVISVGEPVRVKVLEVDLVRKRISLERL